MSILGRKLVVTLIASGAGCLAGLHSGASELKSPIVQTIAAAQPARVKLVVFHPSANPEPAATPAAPAPTPEPAPEAPRRSEPATPPRTAPVTREALAMSSDPPQGLVNPWRRSAAKAASKRPSERAGKRASARFGQSEIVDPWSTQR